MSLYEQKVCARCECLFECKVSNIGNCMCSTITLSMEEKIFIEERYNDCLCINCLKDLKNKYIFFKEKYFQ